MRRAGWLLSDPYAMLTIVTIRKVEIMGEDIMCDLWFESQYEVQNIYWEAEAEVIMAHYDEPDFF